MHQITKNHFANLNHKSIRLCNSAWLDTLLHSQSFGGSQNTPVKPLVVLTEYVLIDCSIFVALLIESTVDFQ